MAHEAAKAQREITPEAWQQVRDILANALELPASERSAYLQRSCGEDSLLRDRIDELIAAHDATGAAALDAVAFSVTSSSYLSGAEPNHSVIGRRIGAYRIEAEIGHGGMGRVYRAVRADDEYKKQVAIKLMDSGTLSSRSAELFRHERQILATLDHPNIARLLDGGTDEDGSPYLVMEYVEGQTISHYCDHNRLPIEERLKLFQKVCLAVQFAHQNLVVHRDIKPANILVTAVGEPKLLDFGIAKILKANSTETQTRTFAAMTPAYASPEQLNGQTVTTATDVYSLGMVLYELLTGRYAYEQFSSPARRQQAILQDDPERPSQVVLRESAEQGPISAQQIAALRQLPIEKLSKRLAGDIESIIAQAVRKEPEYRYNSIDQLSGDLQRHLEGLPVLARKNTVAYRASKFISRHKLGVAAAAAITITIIAGLMITLHEARVARTERALAEQRFTDVRELARSNLFEFNDAIQNLPGSAPARHLVIQRALGYLDKLSRDAGGDPGLMQEMATGYERIASLQGNFSGPGIGDSKAALASYQKALTIRESLVVRSKHDPAELKAEARLLGNIVQTLIICGRIDDASRAAMRELSVAEPLVQTYPGDPDAILELARAHARIAWVMGGSGSSASTRDERGALRHSREVLTVLAQAPGNAKSAASQRAILQAQLMQAEYLRKNREFDESLKSMSGLLAISKKLPEIVRFTLFNRQALALDEMGDFKRAYRADQEALAAAAAMREAEPRDLAAQINFAIAQGSAGLEYARLGHTAIGQKQVDEAVHVGESLLAANPAELFYKDLLLIGYAYQAEIFSLAGNQAAAEEKYSQSLAAATELAQSDPGDLESQLSIAKLHVAIGVVLARAKRYPEARQEFDTALTHLQELLQIRPEDADAIYVSRRTRENLATVNNCLGNHSCNAIREFHLPNLNN